MDEGLKLKLCSCVGIGPRAASSPTCDKHACGASINVVCMLVVERRALRQNRARLGLMETGSIDIQT